VSAAETLSCDALVVGSGPGGAMTAALLAEAGRDVVLMEEGPHLRLSSAPAHSLEEMAQKYRNDGLTPALGPTKVTYVEGRCVGGASEINAGLYHRPLAEVLDRWAVERRLANIAPEALAPHIEAVEQELGVATHPGGIGPHAERLVAGADALGWRHKEIARFWRYGHNDPTGVRQSMTETLIPRALAAGCRLLPSTRAQRLLRNGRGVVGCVGRHTGPEGRARVTVRARATILCAGAVHTPLLMRRSGLQGAVGDSLTMNPMIRVAARFADVVNDPHFGVPVQQVEEFKPGMTLGCSHSSLAHLALWMPGRPEERAEALQQWPRTAIFYVKVGGSARGTVRNLPFFDEALVRFPVTVEDLALLGEGLVRLTRLLFAAGATEVLNPLAGGDPVRSTQEGERFRGALRHDNVSLSAIHLHSTCPMGGEGVPSVTDPWGRVRDVHGLWVNDSSALPDTPGINPQGLILAVARRNVLRWLEGV